MNCSTISHPITEWRISSNSDPHRTASMYCDKEDRCIDRENILLVIMVTLGTEVQMLGGLANVGTKKSIFRML